MSFDINNIRSLIAKEGGVAKANRFEVTIDFNYLKEPRDLGADNFLRRFYNKENLDTASKLRFLCDSATLPGISFQTEEARTYGAIVKTPYVTLYEDFQLGFICTGNMKERLFFDDWFSTINDPRTNDFNYVQDYSSTITVKQFNENAKRTYFIKFLNAYPIAMQPLEVNWASNDTIHRLNITFAFRIWVNDGLLEDTYAPSQNDIGFYNYVAGEAPPQLNRKKLKKGI